MSEENCSESKWVQLLCDDGMQRSADGSMKARDAVKGVLDLHPSASKLALCTLANLLTKPDSNKLKQAKQRNDDPPSPVGMRNCEHCKGDGFEMTIDGPRVCQLCQLPERMSSDVSSSSHWCSATAYPPKSEGFYLYRRTKRDAPTVKLFTDSDGFGRTYVEAEWCKIPN